MYGRSDRDKKPTDTSNLDEHAQGFYPAPPRPQPFNQSSNFVPVHRNHPSSPSTTLNVGNGYVDQPAAQPQHLSRPAYPNGSYPMSGSTSGLPDSSFQPQPRNAPTSMNGLPSAPQNINNQSYYNHQQQNAYQQPNPAMNQPAGMQFQPQQQVPAAVPNQQNPSMPSMQSAVPFMMAGFQQLAGSTNAGNVNHAALGAQILETIAPGAAGYTSQIFGEGQSTSNTFMRIPKYYFAVNHRYVLRKLSLILMPFMNRTWSRQRGIDNGAFDGPRSEDGTSYLPPRDDVNAPDLYIPVMSFVTYVLVVGFVFGTRNAFKAEVLANYFSRGLGVLTMEVLVIKLLLYLINARPTSWLDVIAYRGYKFIGVVLTIALGLFVPRLYVPSLIYCATAMGIFLMRSHRRIILPRDMEMHESQDLARRNAFLLFVCVLQYPIYWILARVLYVKTG